MYILILIFKRLRYVLAGLYGHFFGREGSAFLSTMSFFSSWLLGFLKNKLFRTFLNVYLWYFLSWVLILALYIILKNSPMILYNLILLVLIGLIFDNRINKIRKFIFTILLILHIVFWNFGYWQTEVIIIKELFWYSLVLMSCFIWHVLILNWVFRLVDKAGWDYGRYLVSRVSLVTSLMGIIWIMQWFIYILEDKYTFEVERNIHPTAVIPNGPRIFIFTISNMVLVICHILLVIFEYFSYIFQNYAKLLIGVGEITKFWEMPVKFYLLLVITFLISIIIGIPRVYLMWVVIIVWNIKKILWAIPKYWRPRHPRVLLENIILELTRSEMKRKHLARFIKIEYPKSERRLGYSRIDRLTSEWKLIYEEGLFRDYYWYSSLNYWHRGAAHYFVVLDVYQVWVDVFNYSRDRELRILGRICYNYWISRQIDWYDEISPITISDMEKLEEQVERVQRHVYNSTLLFEIKRIIPYVKKVEQDCSWTIRTEEFLESNGLEYARRRKYFYIY